MSTLAAAHRGYNQQDVVTAYHLALTLIGKYDAVTVDRKEGGPSDPFDDLSTRSGSMLTRRQIKSSENAGLVFKYSTKTYRLRGDAIWPEGGQLATAGHNIDKNFGAARIKYDVASKLVADAEKARAAQGKSIPLPVFDREDLIKMSDIANRNKDTQLLGYVYNQVKDRLLANPDQEALSSVKGKAVMARMEMLKQAERLKAAIEYGEFRQLPIRNVEGWDYTKSLKEVEPKNALEFIVRHFTDTTEQKRERQAVADCLASQLKRAQGQSTKARDWSVVRDAIARDYCRAAGVRDSQVEPDLNRDQIAELRAYAETLPYLSFDRKEFREAASMAEQGLQQGATAL